MAGPFRVFDLNERIIANALIERGLASRRWSDAASYVNTLNSSSARLE